jgi:hypothetical protein
MRRESRRRELGVWWGSNWESRIRRKGVKFNKLMSKKHVWG